MAKLNLYLVNQEDENDILKIPVGVAYCDPSTVPISNSSKTSIVAEEWADDCFNLFRENRGKTFYPREEEGKVTKSRIYIKTVDEIIQDASFAVLKNVINKAIEDGYQNELYSFTEKKLVSYVITTENPDNGGTNKTIMDCISYDGYTELFKFAHNLGVLTAAYNGLSQPRSNFTYGVGIWNIKDTKMLSFGSAYGKVKNDKTIIDGILHTVDYNASRHYEVFPSLVTYSNVALGDKEYLLNSFIMFCKGANVNTTVYMKTLYPDYTGADANYKNNYSMNCRYFLLNAESPKNEGFPDGGKPEEPSGGGGGMYDPTDLIPLDPLPNVNISGMLNVYKITSEQLQGIHDVLWSNDMVANLLSITQSPYDCVVGLYSLPYSALGSDSTIKFGNIDSGISAQKIQSQFFEIDCGVISISEFWGSFLDYSPYTSIKLYLPYIGTVNIDTDSFMGDICRVVYRIDIVSGACVAIIMNNNGIVDSFSGNLATQLPLSMNDKSAIFSSTITKAIGGIGNIASGNVAGAVADTASMVAGMKSRPSAMTTYNGNNGAMLNMKPYLIISRPTGSIPSEYKHNKGLRSNITRKLSETKGFCIVDSIHLDNIPCTAEEKVQIENYLKNGVII